MKYEVWFVAAPPTELYSSLEAPPEGLAYACNDDMK